MFWLFLGLHVAGYETGRISLFIALCRLTSDHLSSKKSGGFSFTLLNTDKQNVFGYNGS